ncbi:hypothetical protein [Roseibium sp.]|uniref:hypothetical protein n=1 Tax=Roseibium sp. TaxID=1936156 RepID=UPI003BAE8167
MSIHRDQAGLSTAELMMLAAFVLIPVIIAAGVFGSDILEALSGGVGDADDASGKIEYKRG